ncbi:C45 family peptidase [Photorhabdus sp. P32]|uniref:C45 family peptidase n=1 Tax=Photorhabdus sp. P32 TaxID=3117549 RepID=UPI00311ACA10
MTSVVDFITLNGDALTRGIQHGQQQRVTLQAFADDGLCRLNQLSNTSHSLQSLASTISAYRSQVETWLPDLAQEVEGLAIGASLPPDLAWLLQLRREVIGYSSITTGDCTTLSSLKGVRLLAQTVDLNGNLDDFISVLDCQGPHYRSLLLSFAGLLGYLGLNNAGLAVGLNLVLGGNWGIGVPPYLVIRHLLDNCVSIEQALEELNRIPLSSSRSFTLCDKHRAVCVESLNNQLRIVEDGITTTHTNHFLHVDFIPQDKINIFAKNSSLHRLEIARTLTNREQIDVEDCFTLFAKPPIYVGNNGNIRRERTISSVVMLPEQGVMLLCPGNPSLIPTQQYSLPSYIRH